MRERPCATPDGGGSGKDATTKNAGEQPGRKHHIDVDMKSVRCHIDIDHGLAA